MPAFRPKYVWFWHQLVSPHRAGFAHSAQIAHVKLKVNRLGLPVLSQRRNLLFSCKFNQQCAHAWYIAPSSAVAYSQSAGLCILGKHTLAIPEGAARLGFIRIRPWTCSFFLWGMKCPRRFGILGSLLLLIRNAFCYWPIVTNSRFFFRKISMVIWACWHQLGFFWCGFKNKNRSLIKGKKTSKNWTMEEELLYTLQFSSVFQKEAKTP